MASGLKLALTATGSFFAIFALIYFFNGFIIGINISLVVVEATLKDIILGIKVVVEVVVKVAVGLWLWLGAGAVIPTIVSTGLPSMGSLSSPIKKNTYIKNKLTISIRL